MSRPGSGRLPQPALNPRPGTSGCDKAGCRPERRNRAWEASRSPRKPGFLFNPPLGSPPGNPGPVPPRYIIPSEGAGPGAGKTSERHPWQPGHSTPPGTAVTLGSMYSRRVVQGRVVQGGTPAWVVHPGYTTWVHPAYSTDTHVHARYPARCSPSGLPRLAIQPAVLSPAGTLQQRASLVAGFVTLESGSEPPSGSPWEAWNRAQNDPRDTLGSLESGLE